MLKDSIIRLYNNGVFDENKIISLYIDNKMTKDDLFSIISPTLDNYKRIKIEELKKDCNSNILSGFQYVHSDGITYTLGFDQKEDQPNITQQMAILSVSPEPIIWKVKGELVFLQFTRDEFLQMGLVAKQHKESKMQKYYQLCGQVYACENQEEVDAICWD